jgi:hypothetical protein
MIVYLSLLVPSTYPRFVHRVLEELTKTGLPIQAPNLSTIYPPFLISNPHSGNYPKPNQRDLCLSTRLP